MDFESKHFKYIDLKSKTKSKSEYPNATLMKWAILFIIIYETEKAVPKSMDQSASRKQRNKEVFYDMPPLRGGLDYV